MLYSSSLTMSTDLNSQGSSTPSRKRSKWDEGDDVEDLSAPMQVHATKKRTKHSKRPRLQASWVSPSPTPSPPPPARLNHSIYVPPRTWHPTLQSSRSVYCYERLNQIEEGSYGVVFRAKDKQTGDIVALKKLKLDEEKNGFPITALREIHSLMTCRHENVVRIREVVVGDTLTQCVCPTLFFRLVAIYNNHTCFFGFSNTLSLISPCEYYNDPIPYQEYSLSWILLSTISRHCSRTCHRHSFNPRSRL
jgi:hypothetical protein